MVVKNYCIVISKCFVSSLYFFIIIISIYFRYEPEKISVILLLTLLIQHRLAGRRWRNIRQKHSKTTHTCYEVKLFSKLSIHTHTHPARDPVQNKIKMKQQKFRRCSQCDIIKRLFSLGEK